MLIYPTYVNSCKIFTPNHITVIICLYYNNNLHMSSPIQNLLPIYYHNFSSIFKFCIKVFILLSKCTDDACISIFEYQLIQSKAFHIGSIYLVGFRHQLTAIQIFHPSATERVLQDSQLTQVQVLSRSQNVDQNAVNFASANKKLLPYCYTIIFNYIGSW